MAKKPSKVARAKRAVKRNVSSLGRAAAKINLENALNNPVDEAIVWEEPPALGTNPKDLLGIKKPSPSLCPPSAVIYMALGFADGAVKYGPYNWRENKVQARIYIDACMRHLYAWLDGEELADDSQKPHLGHALASIAIIIDALETGNLVDNRPLPGAAPALIKKWTKS